MCELPDDLAESKNLACVDASYAIVANQEIREKPCTHKLEWENPENKNLLVYRIASLFDASNEHESKMHV
jgi:hypothetical protein